MDKKKKYEHFSCRKYNPVLFFTASRLELLNTSTASVLGCKIYPKECPVYDIKQSDGEAPATGPLGISGTSSLPLLPGLLWPRVAAGDRALSMSQNEGLQTDD